MSEVLAGRYDLGERLGVGGMSTVRLARDRRLEREVAVKVLAEHLAEDPQFVARFRREALAAARLVHPNIVQVFDFGLDEPTGRHYIVMEHIRGQSAAEILRERSILPVSEALAIVAHACRGLDYAHRNGVVHRDIKPGNLLRSEEGIVKVADFGIARNIGDESSITQVGSVLGTAAYLAPEQAHGEEAGPRADLYGLGVVTYQALSGRLPYEANSLTELALKQQREAPPLLNHLNPEVTPQLAAAVDRALALEAADRFASAEDMRQALADGVRGVGPMPDEDSTHVLGSQAQTAPTSVSPRRDPATADQPVVARQPQPSRRPAPPPPVAAPQRSAGPARRQSPQRRRRGALRRFITMVVILLLVVAVAVAVTVGTSNDNNSVHLREIVGQKAQDIVDQVQQLVKDNTQ
jgi:eukaryotic-like serine/threonine-protein kinase